jgi:LuxR family maltose regulon positive regulatory protein
MTRPHRLVEPLTTRELQILTHMCDGLSNDEISRNLHVSLDTVKFHLKNAYGKLGVTRRTQAVATAVYLDLVRPTWAAGYVQAMPGVGLNTGRQLAA